ncbi:FHA domain-containing protein [Thermodesulfobacteriota bacterium]
MGQDKDRTIRADSTNIEKTTTKKIVFSTTLEIDRKTFIAKRPIGQHAFLEVIGEVNNLIRLAEEEVLIGRVPECDVQLLVENVSRKHAKIFYINEEYHVKDLNSTNGIFLNGIKVEKGILRDQDILEIGGVKIVFREGKIR